MKTTRIISTAFIAVLCAVNTVNAQSTIANKVEQTGKDVEKVSNTYQSVKKIFKSNAKGKNKPADSTLATGSSDAPTAEERGSAAVPSSGASVFGSVAPDAIYLDVDELFYFNHGAAVVKKGSSTALIDAKGNFIVPFNRYRIKLPIDGVRNNNIFPVLIDGAGGFINSAGKVIAKEGDLLEGDIISISAYNNKTRKRDFSYVTSDGKIYMPGEELLSLSEGIGVVGSKTDPYIHGYKTISGQALTGLIYHYTDPFKDGMAPVGIKNEFGEMKYGYIDKRGKQVIPCMYSDATPFQNGYAKITPKDKSEFEYAIINETGKIVIQRTLKETKEKGVSTTFNKRGLAFGSNYVMDTTGKIISTADFLAGYGIRGKRAWLELDRHPDNRQIQFTQEGKINPVTKDPCIGSIDLVSGKVLDAVFDRRSFNLYFDPVSHLAYASICTGKNANGAPLYREGYINEEGVFVIVKGSGSKW